MRELAREIGSKKRLLLLLDYDGTLVPFKPGQARTRDSCVGRFASSLNARGATCRVACAGAEPAAATGVVRAPAATVPQACARACVRAWSA